MAYCALSFQKYISTHTYFYGCMSLWWLLLKITQINLHLALSSARSGSAPCCLCGANYCFWRWRQMLLLEPSWHLAFRAVTPVSTGYIYINAQQWWNGQWSEQNLLQIPADVPGQFWHTFAIFTEVWQLEVVFHVCAVTIARRSTLKFIEICQNSLFS